MKCPHFWVERTDGYVEQCTPAICLMCGEYGCRCSIDEELRTMSTQIKARRLELFTRLGFAGKEHSLEKELK